MIPEYLKGKSAIQICAEMNEKYRLSHNATLRNYVTHIEGLLLLAVKDALMNCDDKIRVQELIDDGKYHTEDRAVAFLNMVLSKE